jgi:hypothetical protein
VNSVRILLGDITSRWKWVLIELAEEEKQLQIVGEAQGAMDILLQTKIQRADLVVLSQTPDGGEPGACSHLLLEYPNLTVVLVPSDTGQNMLYRMVLHKETQQASKEALRTMLQQLNAK